MTSEMSVNEKRAWFNLAVCCLAALAVFAVYRITASPERASGGLGVLGLLGLQPAIGLGRKRRGEILEDERDAAIRQRAAAYAFGTVWVCGVVTCVTVYARAGERGTVPVTGLLAALWASYVLFTLVYSLLVIRKYRGGE